MPILLLAILFGLAMDYEVFLVSRMREHWIEHHDARSRGPAGFTAASRVVAAAAVIMFSVFAAFVPSGDATLQPIALGPGPRRGRRRLPRPDDARARPSSRCWGRAAWWLPGWLDRVLPLVDIEGEGLARQLALSGWPRPDAGTGVHAEGVTLHDRHQQLVPPLDLDVEPGGLLLVEGGTRTARRALAHLLTGRTAASGGRLKVGGYVLPEQAVLARRSVAWVRSADVSDDAGVAAAVRSALGSTAPPPVGPARGARARGRARPRPPGHRRTGGAGSGRPRVPRASASPPWSSCRPRTTTRPARSDPRPPPRPTC